MDHRRKQGGDLNHPGNRTPETAKYPLPERFAVFLNFVIAVFLQAITDCCLAQAGLNLRLQRLRSFRDRSISVLIGLSNHFNPDFNLAWPVRVYALVIARIYSRSIVFIITNHVLHNHILFKIAHIHVDAS